METLTAELVKEKYEELTDNNMHGEAMLLIAEYFEDYLNVKQLKGINKIHEDLGFLPIALSQYRYTIWNNMCEALPIKELLK